jgi:hypothetical protein
MRGPLPWIFATVGVLALLVVGAALGDREEGETVPAGEWAQSVCGAVGVWRGDLAVIFGEVTEPNAAASAAEEPQSETPQGRTAFIRQSLERAISATEIMVEGVQNAGVPDSAEGEEAAERISEWAGQAEEELEEAEDALDEDPESAEQAIEQLTEAAQTVFAVRASGAQTILEVTQLDPELGTALTDASTCQELREDEEDGE